jgi:hypothetical protein
MKAVTVVEAETDTAAVVVVEEAVVVVEGEAEALVVEAVDMAVEAEALVVAVVDMVVVVEEVEVVVLVVVVVAEEEDIEVVPVVVPQTGFKPKNLALLVMVPMLTMPRTMLLLPLLPARCLAPESLALCAALTQRE